jgi:thioesterase domain-containing protein/acyl carrier protein
VANEDGQSSVFRASLSRSSPWVVPAPFLTSGEAVLPASALLEFTRAAFEHRSEPRAVEFRDVRFLAPFVVPSAGSRDLHLRIEHQAAGAFACYGESEREPFAVGSVRHVDVPPPRRADLGAIRLRCPRSASGSEMGAAEELAHAGPRWKSVLGVDLGVREALVTLALPSVFAADLDTYHLHPALVELATGAAQGIVPGFDSRSTVHVPLSYGRVLLRHRLPARLISHVRLCGADAHASGVFDATFYDEEGEEVAVVERLIIRPHERPGPGPGPTAAAVGAELRRHPESPAEAALRLGITTAEGVEALDRILAADLDPQIIASAVPLEPWLERLRADASRSGDRDDGSGASQSGAMIAAPQLTSRLQIHADDIERDLTAMWRDVLELDDVEAHEDFFDLGGHSLLAVRLFRRIRDTFVVDLPLATLFEAPTIAELAAVLRDRMAAVSPSASGSADNHTGAPLTTLPGWRSLVLVQRGPRREPLFVVHGAGGNVLNVKDLARAMDPSQTVFGLQALGIDGVSAPGASIEQMAQTYLDELRAAQPHGPYLLAGYSGGGVIAFEMARRLDAAGEPIGLLAFIDTFHPHMAVPHIDMFTMLGRLRREGTSYLRDAFDRRRKSRRDDRDGRLLEKHLAAGEPIPLALRELHLIRTFKRAQSQYQPLPWPGKALLFRAEQIDYYYRAGGPAYGWDKTVLGGVEVIPIPGNHDSIMLGANAARIARRLGQAIDEVSKTQGIRTAVNTGSAAPVRTRD